MHRLTPVGNTLPFLLLTKITVQIVVSTITLPSLYKGSLEFFAMLMEPKFCQDLSLFKVTRAKAAMTNLCGLSAGDHSLLLPQQTILTHCL